MKITPGAVTAALAVCLAACGGSTKAPPSLPTPPTITSFKADSSQIDPGGSVTLSFTTENATEARIVDQTGAEIPFEGTASSGTVKVQPAATSFFVLRAKGDGGQDTAFVHVAVGEDLKQVFLAAVPAEIDSGETSQLLWSAYNARSVKLVSTAGGEMPLDADRNRWAPPTLGKLFMARSRCRVGWWEFSARLFRPL